MMSWVRFIPHMGHLNIKLPGKLLHYYLCESRECFIAGENESKINIFFFIFHSRKFDSENFELKIVEEKVAKMLYDWQNARCEASQW